MAGIAGGRQPYKLPSRSTLMAGIAIQSGMRAHEREAIEVILNRLDQDGPAVHRVALLAVGAELPAVNICVAIRAFGSDICENELRVTLSALHFLVHPAEWKAGFVVIKFGDGTNGLPTGRGVAIFARNVDGAVRITRSLELCGPRRTLGEGLKC